MVQLLGSNNGADYILRLIRPAHLLMQDSKILEDGDGDCRLFATQMPAYQI